MKTRKTNKPIKINKSKTKNQKILITGGAGYIATHTLIELNSAN